VYGEKMGIFSWLKSRKQVSINEQVTRINEANKPQPQVTLTEEEHQWLRDWSERQHNIKINNYPTYDGDAFYTTIENGVTGYHRKRRI
jgi:hypothetical protein